MSSQDLGAILAGLFILAAGAVIVVVWLLLQPQTTGGPGAMAMLLWGGS